MTRAISPWNLAPKRMAKHKPRKNQPREIKLHPAHRAIALTLCASPISVRDSLLDAVDAAVAAVPTVVATAGRAVPRAAVMLPVQAAIIIPCRSPKC